MPAAIIVASRRSMLCGLASLIAAPAWATAPPGGRLRFAVYRNDAKVGEQEMSFATDGSLVTMTSSVSMSIRLGPVPLFRYTHRAREQWRDGRFALLETSTSSNGKREQVAARRSDNGIAIETLTGRMTAPPAAAPLTHWNAAAFAGPMFNPQTGRMLKVSVRHLDLDRAPGRKGPPAAQRWTVRGEAEIDNWYEDGVWVALKGRLPDRSMMEYRRI